MKVKDIISVISDKVTLYTEKGESFVDIYTGDVDSIPKSILEMEVICIGAEERDLLDIGVSMNIKSSS